MGNKIKIIIRWVGHGKQSVKSKYPSVKLWFEIFVVANILYQKWLINYNSEETFDMIDFCIQNFTNSRNAARQSRSFFRMSAVERNNSCEIPCQSKKTWIFHKATILDKYSIFFPRGIHSYPIILDLKS